jgi:hypothetical protein
MKRNISLVTNLLLSSTLFWGVPTADGQEGVVRIPAETTSYCHMKFPPILENTLFSVHPLLKSRRSGAFCAAGFMRTANER